MATKQEIEKKKSIARTLFMSGMDMTEIADKVDVSRVTISKWCNADGWKEIRAARNISRQELVNKILLTIDEMLEEANNSKDATATAGIADKLSKFSAAIDKLDKKANVIDAIDVFKAFSGWLEFRSQSDPSITVELIQRVNQLQDMFIIESIGKGGVI